MKYYQFLFSSLLPASELLLLLSEDPDEPSLSEAIWRIKERAEKLTQVETKMHQTCLLVCHFKKLQRCLLQIGGCHANRFRILIVLVGQQLANLGNVFLQFCALRRREAPLGRVNLLN
jgi:hypothetical protein